MSSNFYNRYHSKNRKTQYKVINWKNYTYSIISPIIDYYITLPGKVLDIGCGVGTLSLYLAAKGFKVTGIDLSSRAIRLAKSSAKAVKANNVTFLNLNASQLNEGGRKYDYVICTEVIEHIVNDKKLLRDINLLLKTSGLLLLSTPSVEAPLYKLSLLKNFDKEVGHLRRYSIGHLTSLLENTGYRVEKVIPNEGLIRNALFTLKPFGWLVRFMKWPLYVPLNWIDKLLIMLFGESDILVIARKKNE